MKIEFSNSYLEKLYIGEPLKGKPLYNVEIIIKFKKTILQLEELENTAQIKQFKSLNFEALKGNKKGLYSVRVNKQYRLEFKIENDKIKLVEIILIEALSNHYK
jgi:toxin HigB-1